jgi:acyl carrier protein
VANVTAIIGWAGSFSGSPTIETLWRGLAGGAVPAGAPSEGRPWSSRSRLFADGAQQALSDAACTGRLDAERTGVFASGAAGDTLAADLAEQLGLRGPAITVEDAAAMPLAAVARACRSLLSGECDLALAGEISAGGAGGEGALVVVLKRLPEALADGDRIVGALRGTEVQTLAPAPPAVPAAWRDPADTAEPAPVQARPALANPYAPPANRLEAAIASVWQDQLGIDRVGIDDNFFELGGTSIVGVKIIALLKDWLQQEIPTVSLYEGPTVRALAQVLLASGAAKGYDAVRDRGERRRRKLQRLGHGTRPDAADATDAAD